MYCILIIALTGYCNCFSLLKSQQTLGNNDSSNLNLGQGKRCRTRGQRDLFSKHYRKWSSMEANIMHCIHYEHFTRVPQNDGGRLSGCLNGISKYDDCLEFAFTNWNCFVYWELFLNIIFKNRYWRILSVWFLWRVGWFTRW